MLLTAVPKLETAHELEGPEIPQYLDEMAARHPRLAAKYQRSDGLVDVLFKATYNHKRKVQEMAEVEDTGSERDECDSCLFCNASRNIPRETWETMVHCGSITSSNQVIKNGTVRDQLSHDLGDEILCVVSQSVRNTSLCSRYREKFDGTSTKEIRATQIDIERYSQISQGGNFPADIYTLRAEITQRIKNVQMECEYQISHKVSLF